MTSSEKPSLPHGTKDKTPATLSRIGGPVGWEQRFDHQAVCVRGIAQSAKRHGEPSLGLGITPGVDSVDQLAELAGRDSACRRTLVR